jgi:hypothetical protein
VSESPSATTLTGELAEGAVVADPVVVSEDLPADGTGVDPVVDGFCEEPPHATATEAIPVISRTARIQPGVHTFPIRGPRGSYGCPRFDTPPPFRPSTDSRIQHECTSSP